MTEPRDPGETDPADFSLDPESRRGRHWAPDDGDEEPEPDGPQNVDTTAESDAEASGVQESPAAASVAQESDTEAPPSADQPAEPAVVAAGSRNRPRHAASGSGLRLPPWMLAVAAVIVIGLIVWLVIGLTTGSDTAEEPPAATSSSAAETTSAAPTPVDPVSLPQVLCMGQSYAMLETGLPTEQLLADPSAVEAQYPGSKLSTIPPGCLADSDERDAVVLALGPFPTITEACDAGTTSGVPFTAYEGSADTGLEIATCPAA